ncbi:MAG TPA: S8/S53 family peptidase, partial [Puia sp.]|nr:S8/S53 family peptidase [Puia sp.]
MKKNNQLPERTSNRISRKGIFFSMILFLQAFIFTSTAQTLTFQEIITKRSRDAYAYSDTAKRWLDWNILFHQNASDQDKEKCINYLKAKIEASISAHNSRTGENFHVDYHVVYCPCDSSLTNLNATPVGAVGNIVPPKPPGTGGSGDLVSLNSPIAQDPRPEEQDSITDTKVPLTINSVDQSKLLAIMDTGLDPDLFGPDFTKLIWKDPGPNPTLRNFQFYHNRKPLDYMQDDDAHIHGTAVTTIALQEFEKAPGNTSNPKPMIMVLKVLDEQGKGNTFSLSCGLSYVVQKKATLVNASLGYYSNGNVDPILLHYVRLCSDVNPVPIPILAAAGNIHGPHDRFKLCDPSDNGNKLTKTNTF